MCPNYLFWVLYSKACMKLRDIDDQWKRLMQTWFDFDQDIIDTAID